MIRVRGADVAWREIDGEVLLLNLATSTYFTVNASATLLWHTLADGDGVTRDDLVTTLSAAYGLAEEQAAEDVDGFLERARKTGLVLEDETGEHESRDVA